MHRDFLWATLSRRWRLLLSIVVFLPATSPPIGLKIAFHGPGIRQDDFLSSLRKHISLPITFMFYYCEKKNKSRCRDFTPNSVLSQEDLGISLSKMHFVLLYFSTKLNHNKLNRDSPERSSTYEAKPQCGRFQISLIFCVEKEDEMPMWKPYNKRIDDQIITHSVVKWHHLVLQKYLNLDLPAKNVAFHFKFACIIDALNCWVL